MKKTLIALSLAALSGAAFADVTLYGQVKAGFEVSKTTNKNGNVKEKEHTISQVKDLGSRIGFKGQEALGNGTNVIWKLEQNASVAGNSQGWATREGYIGVETAAGTVRAGKIGTPLDGMGVVDPWEYKNEALGLAQFTRTGGKVVSVRYDSPEFYGLSGSVQFTPRDNAETREDGEPTKAAYYTGLNYANSGFFAKYGFGLKKHNALDAKGKQAVDGKAHRLEAGYDANNLFVGVGLQYTKGWDRDDSPAKSAPMAYTATKEAVVTASYRFGNVTPKVSYAHGWDETKLGKKQANTKYDQVVVGADYDFSKRTTAFAQAGWLRVGDGVDAKNAKQSSTTTAALVGLRHKF